MAILWVVFGGAGETWLDDKRGKVRHPEAVGTSTARASDPRYLYFELTPPQETSPTIPLPPLSPHFAPSIALLVGQGQYVSPLRHEFIWRPRRRSKDTEAVPVRLHSCAQLSSRHPCLCVADHAERFADSIFRPERGSFPLDHDGQCSKLYDNGPTPIQSLPIRPR